MGTTTNITIIRNMLQSNDSGAYVYNHENPFQTPSQTPGQNGIYIAPGGGAVECNITIPWAQNQDDFNNGHFISIALAIDNMDIWQCDQYICQSVNVGYIQGCRTPVDGNSTVGGNKALDIVYGEFNTPTLKLD